MCNSADWLWRVCYSAHRRGLAIGAWWGFATRSLTCQTHESKNESLASEALEKVIQEAETKDDVKVTDVEVQVADMPPKQPAVDVTVTVERVPPS